MICGELIYRCRKLGHFTVALKRLVAHSASDVTSGYIQLSAEPCREAGQRVADHMKTLCGAPKRAGANVATIK